uniref:Homologous recombination OB-fold protein OB-fold domain-containing protein n=1 Tax=Gouania willdenowi TaxID=441366 RepID=A0A8C5HWB5_GOUWI
ASRSWTQIEWPPAQASWRAVLPPGSALTSAPRNSSSSTHPACPLLAASRKAEDLLTTDWSASGPAVAPVICSSSLSGPSSSHPQSEPVPRLQTVQTSAAVVDAPTSGVTHSAASVTPDDFDDWDVDLADLNECDGPLEHPPAPPSPVPPPTAKTLRPSSCGSTRGLCTEPRAASVPSTSSHSFSRTFSAPQSPNPHPRFPFQPLQTPGVFPGLTTAASPAPRSLYNPQQLQRPWATPRASPQVSLFGTVSPAGSSRSCSTALSPHPLHTPVLTNRLVQLVSASSKHPRKRSHSELQQPRTRKFPGPAGLLPQQPQAHNMDTIVVSAPPTPAHGALARSPSQGSSSQMEGGDFSGGGWAAMKAEMGLDERNSFCFLHTHSIVMVLRKAALKQLSRNKVPNMAVLLKSIILTHADAKAVFKDPTGEIQGTVHRRLLEDRAEELKVGAVLLLKQVGVFSPSHRNHYLNVTPNNLLRIYSPDGVSQASSQSNPLIHEPLSSPVVRGPVSRMQLVFDDEDDDDDRGKESARHGAEVGGRVDTRPPVCVDAAEHAGKSAGQDPGWEADDDLDELLGDLPEETYSL